MSALSPVVRATITAQDNWTDPLALRAGETALISGDGSSFTGSVSLQTKVDETGGWVTSTKFAFDSSDARVIGNDTFSQGFVAPGACEVRLGVATGDFGGTNIVLTLSA